MTALSNLFNRLFPSRDRNVTSILGQFHKAVDELRSHAGDMQVRACQHEEAADDHYNAMIREQDECDNCLDEEIFANRKADEIEKFLS